MCVCVCVCVCVCYCFIKPLFNLPPSFDPIPSGSTFLRVNVTVKDSVSEVLVHIQSGARDICDLQQRAGLSG